MKALKEKRISLRSLLRRSLVILGLFALVFASCGDTSSSSSSGTTGDLGKLPVSIEVITQPSNSSYQGMPIDLTGMQVLVRYNTGPMDAEIVTDISKFDTYPRFATGTYGGYDSSGIYFGGPPSGDPNVYMQWYEITNYTLYYYEKGRVYDTTVWIPGVIQLVRQNTAVHQKLNNPAFFDIYDDSNNWGEGVQLTGLATMRTRRLYVDDYPDFGGLTCEANYVDGSKQIIVLNSDRKWEIRPRYDNMPETGKGELLIWVGEHPGFYEGWWDEADPGIVVMAPYEEVWHVSKLEFETEPELKAVYYWEIDTLPSGYLSPWIERCMDAVLRVTYSNGQTKRFTVQQALDQNRVYLNGNPHGYDIPFDVEGIDDTAHKRLGVASSVVWPAYREPQVNFYYRGHRAFLPIAIYNRFSGLTAEVINGEEVAVDMLPQDNDYAGRDAAWFATQIRVVATFTASSNPDLLGELPLTYDEETNNTTFPMTNGAPPLGAGGAGLGAWNTTLLLSGTPIYGGPLSYSMDFGEQIYNSGTGLYTTDSYGQCSLTTNNGRVRAVSIYYTPGIAYNLASTGASVPTAARRARVNVAWSNIPN